MKKLIVVADWASDSLTCEEIHLAVEGFLKDPTGFSDISFVSSTPSTIHTAYLLRQVVEIEERFGRPQETIVFQNTDPRLQTKDGVEEAKGAEFIVLRLQSGLYVCGPNAGYDFSLIKDRIQVAYIYKDLDKGSQFRSRDLYSRVCAHLIDGLEKELDLEEVSSGIIPSMMTKHYIGHIDNYGNIKTTFTAEDFKGKFELNDELTVVLNGQEKKAKYVSNLFGGGVGNLVVYPGSSGKKENPFLEISVWTHFDDEKTKTGIHHFNNPKPGMEVTIK